MLRRSRRLIIVLLIASIAILQHGTPASAAGVPGPIRLVPEDDSSYIRLEARFPPKSELCPARQPRNLHAAYPGVIEIGRRSNGKLYLVTELTFPKYLEGIAEVPRDWPLDSLKAQVVAARTYAFAHMNPSNAQARELRYNLCATDSCQVYRGLNVANGAWGEFWVQAVRETAGEILEHDGKPANTFYFSTSNGRTYSNTDAFGGSPLPYLKPVDEKDDGGSPVRTWTVRMPLQDLSETLRLAKAWGAGTIERVTQTGDNVNVSGGGTESSMTVTQLRSRLNAQAVCLTPKRYPTQQPNGRPLPQVVPSKWFVLRQEGSDLVLEGQGWGHGVGMVQWGLKGKAERGMNYQDMLAFYYGGLRPVKREEPSSIRIGLAVDIEEVAVERVGRVRVEGAEVPDGILRLTGGNAFNVEAGGVIEPQLRITELSLQSQAAPDAPLTLSFNLSGPAKVKLLYRGPAEGETAIEPRDRGAQTLSWNPTGLPAGSYEVHIHGHDGVDQVLSDSLQATVTATVASPSPSPARETSEAVAEDTETPAWLSLAIAGAVLLIGSGLVLYLRIRRRKVPAQR